MATVFLNPAAAIALQIPATKSQAALETGSEAGLFWLKGDAGDGRAVAVGLLWAPVGFLFGSAYGSLRGASAGEVEEAYPILTNVTDGLHLAEELRARLYQINSAISSDRKRLLPIQVDLAECVPHDPDSVHNLKYGRRVVENSYRHLSASQVDSVLEIRVDQLGLLGPDRINPPLGMTAKVRVRVISTRDNRVLFSEDLVYDGPKHRFVDWAEEEGQLFLKEYDQCVLELERDLESLVFGQGATNPEVASN